MCISAHCSHVALCLMVEGSEWQRGGFCLSFNLVNELMAVRLVPLMRLHMHCGSHHRSSSPRPFKGNYCFKCSSRCRRKVTLHASLREEVLRQTEGVIFPLRLETKCFYTPTVLLSSGGWGVLLRVCVDGECERMCICLWADRRW